MHLVLVRHARSAHVTRKRWIDVAGVHRWREEYDAAGIDPSDAPPRALVELCTTAECLAASDLPRAIASAERLAPGRPVRVSALLRESAPRPGVEES